MKRILICAAIAALMPLAANAQSSNPVSDSVKQMVAQHAKAIIAAAEEMPADKYGYKPTPEQLTFGHMVMHLAQSNTFLCSTIAGTKPPEGEKLTETDPKDKLVGALKTSFDYCSGVLDKTDDSKLGEMLPLFRGNVPRARVMITLVADLYDHYSAEAAYLRLNGMLPPTAQPRPKQ
ncbi:MAG TPA: DinB family protein [Candidatus Acidoferrales bacterium]|nr:DinB family protein [Candidatus Acidoferrales bacterium]